MCVQLLVQFAGSTTDDYGVYVISYPTGPAIGGSGEASLFLYADVTNGTPDYRDGPLILLGTSHNFTRTME